MMNDNPETNGYYTTGSLGTIRESKKSSRKCYIKTRHVVVLMSFIAKFNLFSMRTNLSVAIVAMVNHTEKDIPSNSSEVCQDQGSLDIDNDNSNGAFDWDIGQQSLLLGCYYYGYIFSNIVGGYLLKRFGIKIVLGISMSLSSIVTLCSPLFAKIGFGSFVTARVLLGILQGPVCPTVHAAIGKWIPPLERTRAIAISSSGNSVGTLVTLPLAGIIANQLGWEAVFFITGCAALVFSLLWVVLIHDSPSNHPRISNEEKTYIEKTIGKSHERNELPTPWKSIITSIPLWATIIGFLTCNWITSIFMSLLPTYMSLILRFNLAATGTLAALPYLLQFLVLLVAGYISDVIRRRHIAKTVTVRKVNSFGCLILPSVFLVLAGYSGCNVVAAVSFFCISIAFIAFNATSHEANIIDIAPRYSEITSGIVNGLGNLPGILGPQISGLILLNGQTIQQWQYVFWLSAIIAVLGFVVFVIFASGEEQPWARPICNNDESKKTAHFEDRGR